MRKLTRKNSGPRPVIDVPPSRPKTADDVRAMAKPLTVEEVTAVLEARLGHRTGVRPIRRRFQARYDNDNRVIPGSTHSAEIKYDRNALTQRDVQRAMDGLTEVTGITRAPRSFPFTHEGCWVWEDLVAKAAADTKLAEQARRDAELVAAGGKPPPREPPLATGFRFRLRRYADEILFFVSTTW